MKLNRQSQPNAERYAAYSSSLNGILDKVPFAKAVQRARPTKWMYLFHHNFFFAFSHLIFDLPIRSAIHSFVSLLQITAFWHKKTHTFQINMSCVHEHTKTKRIAYENAAVLCNENIHPTATNINHGIDRIGYEITVLYLGGFYAY